MAKKYNNRRKGSSQAKTSVSVTKSNLPLKILLAAIILGIGLCAYFFAPQLDKLFGIEPYTPPDNTIASVRDASDVVVHMLDVGQGDCLIVELPDGKTMLVDGGDNITKYINSTKQYIKDTFGETHSFDYSILTHSDADHAGGIDKILAEYPSKRIYRPNIKLDRDGYIDPGLSAVDLNSALYMTTTKYVTSTTATYQRFLDKCYPTSGTLPEVVVVDARKPEKTPSRPNGKTSIDILGDGYEIKFLAPFKTMDSANNASTVIYIKVGEFGFLLTGDAEKEAEHAMIDYHSDFDFDVDFLKVGHHGSRSSTTVELLDRIARDGKISDMIAGISCGTDNTYGHPHESTLGNLRSSGVKDQNVLRTDLSGTVAIGAKDGGEALMIATVKGMPEGAVFHVYFIVLPLSVVIAASLIFVRKRTSRSR